MVVRPPSLPWPPVSKYGFTMLCLEADGSASLEEIIPILERRERERELARQRLERQKAEKAGK